MSSESAFRDGKETTTTLIPENPDFQLIETMRWEPETGILRGKRHLDRLENSAHILGFQFNMDAIRQKLSQALHGTNPLRVRLALAPDGTIDLNKSEFIPTPQGSIWNIAIATIPLSSKDPLLRYKTTRRQTYLAARDEFSSTEIDEVILLNEKGQVCEGTISSIFIDLGDDMLITPPLDCGLLDGVLRRELLDEGTVREGSFTLQELKEAHKIYVGNSLRGLIPAKLIC